MLKGSRHLSLLPWDGFKNEVYQWASSLTCQNNHFYDPPVWVTFRSMCRELSELQPFIKKNILEPVVKPFAGWSFEHSWNCETPIRGEPNFVLEHDDLIHSGVLVQGKWKIHSDQNICSKYDSDHLVTRAVNRLYSYLGLNHLSSGILTTYDMTWFFESRVQNGEEFLYVSDGIEYDSRNPTLFQCFAYFMHNVTSDNYFDFPSLKQDSSAGTIRNNFTEDTFHNPMNNSFNISELRFGDKIGEGRTGVVFEVDGGLTALKTLDIAREPKILPEVLNEISMYSRMKSLQGRVISTIRYCGTVESILFVVGFDNVGKFPEKLDENQKQKLYDSLKEIHSLGILHGDLKPNNIVVDPKGNPYFIDFGFSKLETDCE